jgi:hypothetical protein
MLQNGIKYIAIVGSLALFTAAACSDDDTSTTTNTTTTTTATGTTTTTTGGMGGGGGNGIAECVEACSTLYDCGLEMDGADQLCPGFTGAAAEKEAFVGDADGGCVANCQAQPLLKGFIDGDNCPSTIDTIKGVSDAFENVCDNGFGG